MLRLLPDKTGIPEVIGGSFVYSEPRSSESIAEAVIAVRRGDYQKNLRKASRGRKPSMVTNPFIGGFWKTVHSAPPLISTQVFSILSGVRNAAYSGRLDHREARYLEFHSGAGSLGCRLDRGNRSRRAGCLPLDEYRGRISHGKLCGKLNIIEKRVQQ